MSLSHIIFFLGGTGTLSNSTFTFLSWTVAYGWLPLLPFSRSLTFAYELSLSASSAPPTAPSRGGSMPGGLPVSMPMDW